MTSQSRENSNSTRVARSVVTEPSTRSIIYARSRIIRVSRRRRDATHRIFDSAMKYSSWRMRLMYAGDVCTRQLHLHRRATCNRHERVQLA